MEKGFSPATKTLASILAHHGQQVVMGPGNVDSGETLASPQ